MVDLNRRIRIAAESILENEALRGGLGDEQAATTLLNWGIACAEKLTLETANIEDDEEADDAIYPRMKALRKLLVAVSEIATAVGLEMSALQGNIATVFEFAQRIHGENWQAPEAIDDETWLVLLNGNNLERIVRRWGVAGALGERELLNGIRERITAEAILASSSPSSTLEKRMASAMVWRWMKISFIGPRRNSSPTAAGVSMK